MAHVGASDRRADQAAPDAPPPLTARRAARWAAVALVPLFVVWLALVGNSALSAYDELRQGRSAMIHGRDQLLDGDVATARADFERAQLQFASADQRLTRPHMRLAGLLPWLGNDLRTAAGLSAAGALGAQAGAEVATAIEELPGGIMAFAPSAGALPLDALAHMAGPVAQARDLLAEARDAAARTPERGLIGPVAKARAELTERLADAHAASDSAAALTRSMPALLGADAPRQYFFGSTNPAELRGTGGFLGAFAILTVDRGRLSFGEFHPIQDLPDVPASQIEPPNPDYAARYNRFGGAGKWMNSNATPDFPSAAIAIGRSWQHVTGEQLDGVIFADPHALAALLKVAGPTEVPGVGMVDAGSIVPFLSNEAYVQFDDNDVRKRVLGAVAAATLEGFIEGGGSGDPVATMRALGEAAAEGHLLVHAADADVQSALLDLGVSGALLDPEGDYLAVSVINAAQNKADYYTDRAVRYDVVVHPEGMAASLAEVEFTNHMPAEGLPSHIIGPNRSDGTVEAGDNLSIISVYCASGCEITGFDRSDEDTHEAYMEQELGHPVVMAEMRLPSGSTESMRASWSVADAWQPQRAGGVYQLTFQDQPTIRPTRLEVSVLVPEGMAVTGHSPGMQIDDRLVTWSGDAAGVMMLEVAWDAPAPEGFLARIREVLQRPVTRLGGS